MKAVNKYPRRVIIEKYNKHCIVNDIELITENCEVVKFSNCPNSIFLVLNEKLMFQIDYENKGIRVFSEFTRELNGRYDLITETIHKRDEGIHLATNDIVTEAIQRWLNCFGNYELAEIFPDFAVLFPNIPIKGFIEKFGTMIYNPNIAIETLGGLWFTVEP